MFFQSGKHFPLGINRNIVECKVCNGENPISEFAVLIETLWNVKSEEISDQLYEDIVLIETLWNVKFTTSQSKTSAYFMY